MSRRSASASQTGRFLDELFSSCPPDLQGMFWTLADKRSHWFPAGTAESLTEEVAAMAATSDVYVGVSVCSKSLGPRRRINAVESAGISGLWADVDIAAPDVHKKWNLPPSEATARALIDGLAKPTLLVNSGHGLQAWWLFDEFWAFESESERSSAAELARQWHTTLRVRAAEQGWTVDSVFDLSRVMRIPGTMNRKGDPHVPVELLVDNGPRWAIDDLEALLVDEHLLDDMGISPSRSYVVERLELHENASPPFEKFQAAFTNDPKFRATWERTRKDLGDPSPSAFDLSLASIAVQFGWTDQEIANLLIAMRRNHGDDLKLRQDYYGRTISKARDGRARYDAVDSMPEVHVRIEEARQAGDDEAVISARREAMDSISQQLGLEIVRVIKFTSDPPIYQLVTPTGRVNLGDAGGILNWSRFRTALVGATDVMVPRMRNPQWDALCELIFAGAEPQDVGMESTEAGMIYTWVSDYLMTRPPMEDRSEAAAAEYPYVEEGRTYLFGSSFRRWLWISRGERVSAKDMGRMLRGFGAEPIKLNVVIEGSSPTTRSAWGLPPDRTVERDD